MGELRRFSPQQVTNAGRYLARVVVQEAPERRQRALRAWIGDVPADQTAAVVSALVLALADVVDACREVSPRAREWVRDELEQRPDPFKAARRDARG